MLLLISFLLLFSNFISFYIYNVSLIQNKLTNREKKNRSKNILKKILFIGCWKQSNKFFWILNFINNIVALLGILSFVINIFIKNEHFEEVIGGVVLVAFVITLFFAIISKLIINIKDKQKLSSKIFLTFILALFLIGMTVVISNAIN